ncbi:MAG: bifunctional folylpolyglutamate synthase/dihydrofolate synthase [Clostridia bacterium]|nr:bifunctional folylpolyglutamate synthase/dihydrofolate synthase [Clostridia bacterium]
MNREKYALSFQTDIKLELNKIRILLEKLGNPQDDLEFIHVAGTNGKGSVCAFLESMLVKSGANVGRFSSPELVKKNETIRVCGKEISDDDLKKLIDIVSEVAEEMEEMPSPFEIMCAVAFVYFKEKNCEIVILETGMGGEGDATNIVQNSKICIITHIALDHMQYLGNSVSEITKVKSGIIKRGAKVVTLNGNGDFTVIEKKCSNNGAQICCASMLESVSHKNFNEVIEYKGKKVTLSLCGINQIENASLAVKAAELLGIEEEYIISGLEDTKNPGRFEKLSKGIYFDGAHNPDGAKALRKSLDRYIPNSEKYFIMGVMADKDFDGMLEILNDGHSNFIFVTVQDNPRAMDGKHMAETAKKLGIEAMVFEDMKTAVKNTRGRPLFICGSLYSYKELF